jgi:hypothetical protein
MVQELTLVACLICVVIINYINKNIWDGENTCNMKTKKLILSGSNKLMISFNEVKLHTSYLTKLIFLCPFGFLLLPLVPALLKRPRTPPNNNPAMDYQTADSDHVLKRTRPFGISDEVQYLHSIFSLVLLNSNMKV